MIRCTFDLAGDVQLVNVEFSLLSDFPFDDAEGAGKHTSWDFVALFGQFLT
jgi:hypothetical protein